MVNSLLLISLMIFSLSLFIGILSNFKAYQLKGFKLLGDSLNILGMFALLILILYLWITHKRPPLQTLGDTRLWYSLLLTMCGVVINYKLKISWPLWFCQSFALLFITIDLFNQSAFETLLPPALLSIYFIPHVVVYIIAYALLTCATFIGAKNILLQNKRNQPLDIDEHGILIRSVDGIISMGYAFLTLGLLLGALWAKQAWGHYWTWDPKETWAFITWMIYLIYLHLRYFYYKKTKLAQLFLLGALMMLFICWFGVNYLPTASQSVHTY